MFARVLKALGLKKQKVNVTILGLDNAGKTTIVKHLQSEAKGGPNPSEKDEIAPTIGFNVERFKRGSVAFTVVDMSGASKYRDLWEQYYAQSNAIVFVVDSSDQLRLAVAHDELNMLLNHKELPAAVPLLFFANKKDLPTAVEPSVIASSLRLDGITDHPWHIVPSNAITGEGLDAGLNWLTEQFSSSK